MSLKYIEYEDELKSFYQKNSSYRNGRCIQIHGLPGAGLNLFIDSFIRRYGDNLESEENICCCVIQCPKDHPKTLFIELIQEIAKTIIHMMKKKLVDNSQHQNLEELSELIQKGNNLSIENEAGYHEIEEYVIKAADLCKKFVDNVNIRLFIKSFDRSKKLFEQDINYAMLFKELSEKNSEWLGIAITIHRTLAVIALMIEAFSEFATLYEYFPIKGFHDYQMEQAFVQMESILQFTLGQGAREQVKYYCGSNPKRLNILFTAMEDLQSEFFPEQWSQINENNFVKQAYARCIIQMKKHLDRIMRCVDDLPGDGRNVLLEALSGKQSGYCNSLRELLFEMLILANIEGEHSQRLIVATIPILAEEIDQMERKSNKVKENQKILRILHLSDLHFGSDEDEDDIELRKQYLRSFLDKLKVICRGTPFQYILITGDIGYKAQKNDYEQAEKFINSLLKVCELGADRLFLCPGNHDVNRATIEDYQYPNNQKEADNFLSLKKLDKHIECFQNYSWLCKRLKCIPYQIGKNENYLTGVELCEDCTIACMNTAWFSKNDKMKKIWVGKHYPVAIKNLIDDSKENNPERKELPVITIMHHPNTYWEDEDCFYYNESMNVWAMVTEMSDIILCGHTHETTEVCHTVNSARICGGGTFYQEYTYMNSFYIYELENKKFRKREYQWINEKWKESFED